MSSWFTYVLLGIMLAYLAAGVPILRMLERRCWGANRLKLWEACVAWLLANAGALAFVVGGHWLFPYLHIGADYDLSDVLLFAAGLIASLSVLAKTWFRRRFGRWEVFKAVAAATVCFFIAGMMVFVLHENEQRRDRFLGAVSAKSPADVKQRTLQELSKGLGLDFADDARLLWAQSDRGNFEAPWAAAVVVEISRGNLLAFMEQMGTKGSHRLQECPARLADDEDLYRTFGPWWGPRKWWRPQSAERFEVWTGDHFNVLVDLDDARTARLYIIYMGM
jgi:hypothetical protein